MASPDHGVLRSLLANAHHAQTLRDIDFRGAPLDTMRTAGFLQIERCRFEGADLRHATLDGCCFRLCDLTGVNLRGASLRGASFAGCDLSGADLRDADLYDVRFGSMGCGRGATPTRLVDARFDLGALRSAEVRDDVVLTDW